MALQYPHFNPVSFVIGRFAPRRPPGVSRGLARRLAHVRPTDTMIASYPRSGNTWLRYLLCDMLLQQRGLQTQTTLPIHPDRLIPDLDRKDPLPSETFSPVTSRCIKTHLPWCDAFRRAIAVYRDPADSLCSHYHFCMLCPETRHLTADGIDVFCLTHLDQWAHHLQSYLTASRASACRVMFLTYEQMKQSPAEALEAACLFVGLEAGRAAVHRAVQNHVFERHTNEEKACSQTGEKFFRRGEVGSAQHELSGSTLRTIHQRTEPLVALAGAACQLGSYRRMAG